MASITSGKNEFSLYANGDVRAYLIDKRNDETIAYVKDKSNAGCFGEEMSQYSLEIDDNNWFEVFFDKLNGVETGSSFVSECDNVFETITEIVENIEKWADEYKQ